MVTLKIRGIGDLSTFQQRVEDFWEEDPSPRNLLGIMEARTKRGPHILCHIPLGPHCKIHLEQQRAKCKPSQAICRICNEVALLQIQADQRRSLGQHGNKGLAINKARMWE